MGRTAPIRAVRRHFRLQECLIRSAAKSRFPAAPFHHRERSTDRGKLPMIFQDGELRRIASSKPMLFDGWGYVSIELDSDVAETQPTMERESKGPCVPSETACGKNR